MDGTDPESEALIWKLHRELNGLTRSSRRSAPVEFVSLHSTAKHESKKDSKANTSRLRRTVAVAEPSGERGESNKRHGGSPEDSSYRGSKKKKTEYHDDAGSKDVTARGGSSAAVIKTEPPTFQRNAVSKKQVPRSHSSQLEEGGIKQTAMKGHERIRDEPQASKAHSCASEGTNSKKPKPLSHLKPNSHQGVRPPSPKAPSLTAPIKTEANAAPSSPLHSAQPNVPQSWQPPTDTVHPDPGCPQPKMEPSDGINERQPPGVSHPSNREGQPSGGAGDARCQNPPDTGKGSPLTAAAAAAAAMVTERARAAQRGSTDGGERTLKCFHAGVRWGIALRPQDIQSRADLAQKLNDAFAGEILSCGRGDALHVIFIDSQGGSTEFPSLRSTHVKESLARWQAMVEKAVKIFVRRS